MRTRKLRDEFQGHVLRYDVEVLCDKRHSKKQYAEKNIPNGLSTKTQETLTPSFTMLYNTRFSVS